MDYRMSRKVGRILEITATVSLLLGIVRDIVWLSVLTLVLVVVDYLQTRAFYRCSECHERFDMRNEPPEYCPHCGAALQGTL